MMEVSLVHGQQVYTEHDTIPPGMVQMSCTDDKNNRPHELDTQDQDRYSEPERRQQQKDGRAAKNEHWKLIIMYKQPV